MGTLVDWRDSMPIYDYRCPNGHTFEVFQRFARWRPPGYEDRPGSGLGLFICRGIAREHGGDASLLDGTDGGTILRIELPLEGTGSG